MTCWVVGLGSELLMKDSFLWSSRILTDKTWGGIMVSTSSNFTFLDCTPWSCDAGGLGHSSRLPKSSSLSESIDGKSPPPGFPMYDPS